VNSEEARVQALALCARTEKTVRVWEWVGHPEFEDYLVQQGVSRLDPKKWKLVEVADPVGDGRCAIRIA
jgi:hypothetical protein